MVNGMTFEQRHPRLMRAIKWVAILSTSEASGCIEAYRRHGQTGGEAVDHFGGPAAVIHEAWLKRHLVYKA